MTRDKAMELATQVLQRVDIVSETLHGPRFLFKENIEEIAGIIEKDDAWKQFDGPGSIMLVSYDHTLRGDTPLLLCRENGEVELTKAWNCTASGVCESKSWPTVEAGSQFKWYKVVSLPKEIHEHIH